MIKIKKEIINITNNVTDKYDGPDRDKKVFTYIYTKLAHHIDYDKFASDTCSLSGYDYEVTERVREDASNLIGGLIYGKSLCSGYSEILRNVLSEVGIDCIYISGKLKDQKGSHAWNQVYLDENWYNVDLTNDRDKIVNGIECKHFLKGDQDFDRYKKYDVISPRLEICKESVQNPEQLFNEYKYVQPTVTPKDIAHATHSKNIHFTDIFNIKSLFNKLIHKSQDIDKETSR